MGITTGHYVLSFDHLFFLVVPVERGMQHHPLLYLLPHSRALALDSVPMVG